MLDKILAWDKAWLLAWNSFISRSNFWGTVAKFTAGALIYLVPIILFIVWFFSAAAKKVALRAVLAGGIGLIIAKIIGPALNRPRPFETSGVNEFLFHRPDYSFPSDHAILLFAMAFSFLFSGYKRLAIFMFILAFVIIASRIAVGVHYPSDIIAGALIGLIISWLVHLLDRPLAIVYNFLINIAKKIKLA